MRRLLPDPAEVSVAEAIGAVDLVGAAQDDRPRVALNFAATLDGRVTIEGRSGPIGDDVDREVFHRLRTRADAILVGAGTVRTERYGRLVKPEWEAERRAAGVREEPLGVVVSGSLDLPTDLPVLQDPRSELCVITRADHELPSCPATVRYLREDLDEALARLRADDGIRAVMCEGGPTLATSLWAAELVDELFVTLAPKLAGGVDPLTMIAGALPEPPLALELASVHEAGDALYLRYRRPTA